MMGLCAGLVAHPGFAGGAICPGRRLQRGRRRHRWAGWPHRPAAQGNSRFGAEFDSLSDFLCFGVAPGLILYLWTLQNAGADRLHPLHHVRRFQRAASCAVQCGQHRRAGCRPGGEAGLCLQFLHRRAGAGRCRPRAAPAASLGFAEWGWAGLADAVRHPIFSAVMLFLVGGLMVSTLPSWSFKNFKVPSQMVLLLLLGTGAYIAFPVTEPWAALSLGGLMYFGMLYSRPAPMRGSSARPRRCARRPRLSAWPSPSCEAERRHHRGRALHGAGAGAFGLCLDPHAPNRSDACLTLDIVDFSLPDPAALRATLDALKAAMAAEPERLFYIGCKAGLAARARFWRASRPRAASRAIPSPGCAPCMIRARWKPPRRRSSPALGPSAAEPRSRVAGDAQCASQQLLRSALLRAAQVDDDRLLRPDVIAIHRPRWRLVHRQREVIGEIPPHAAGVENRDAVGEEARLRDHHDRLDLQGLRRHAQARPDCARAPVMLARKRARAQMLRLMPAAWRISPRAAKSLSRPARSVRPIRIPASARSAPFPDHPAGELRERARAEARASAGGSWGGEIGAQRSPRARRRPGQLPAGPRSGPSPSSARGPRRSGASRPANAPGADTASAPRRRHARATLPGRALRAGPFGQGVKAGQGRRWGQHRREGRGRGDRVSRLAVQQRRQDDQIAQVATAVECGQA